VFYGYVQELRVSDCARVDLFPETLVVSLNFWQRRPVFGAIGRERCSYRVDPEGEEPVEVRMERRHAAYGLAQQISFEGFQVPQVKNNAVAVWDRPFVERIAAHDAEQTIRFSARFRKSLQKFAGGGNGVLGGLHDVPPAYCTSFAKVAHGLGCNVE
jgi:hypothetical protein